MSRIQRVKLGIIALVAGAAVGNLQASFLLGEGTDFEALISGNYKPEVFWGNNLSEFNDQLDADRLFYARQTLNLNTNITYGKLTYEEPVVEGRFSLRNRSFWGNPAIARTTESSFKILDCVTGEHKHDIVRQIFWMREAWIRFSLGHPAGLDFANRIELSIGIFPFDLGRGIALGDAYAVGPDTLGFYNDSLVDQFAPGACLSGDIVQDMLSYDLYAALLRNNSGSLSDTGAKIMGQQFGHRLCPARGYGKINYVLAGRLKWTVFDNDSLGELVLEPYALYHDDPEQRVEFAADANTKMGSVGLAGEYEGDSWEFGFDYALNLGRQKVKGWDRNTIEFENRSGKATTVNSHVYLNANPADVTNADDYKAPHAPLAITEDGLLTSVGKQAQSLINSAPQDEMYNGKQIGTVPGFSEATQAAQPVAGDPSNILYNSPTRFRNPYTNSLEGWMVVGDAAWWVYGKDLKVAVTAGCASGDDNPNEVTKDGNYKGFIGIQEAYSGKRVQSTFLLGGAGKAHRPLNNPASDQAPNEFASEVDGFTDLVFVGSGFTWTPSDWNKKFSLNPNVLAYWEQKPTNKFDALQNKELNEKASTYLGLEVNTFVRYNILENLRLFGSWSIFLPGSHYTDIKGKPLSKDQQKALDTLDRTAFDADRVPNIGDDMAMTLNVGLEFQF